MQHNIFSFYTLPGIFITVISSITFLTTVSLTFICIVVALPVRHVQHRSAGSRAIPALWDRDGAGPDPWGPEGGENPGLVLPQMASPD